jgi:hypothetical protein
MRSPVRAVNAGRAEVEIPLDPRCHRPIAHAIFFMIGFVQAISGAPK